MQQEGVPPGPRQDLPHHPLVVTRDALYRLLDQRGGVLTCQFSQPRMQPRVAQQGRAERLVLVASIQRRDQFQAWVGDQQFTQEIP